MSCFPRRLKSHRSRSQDGSCQTDVKYTACLGADKFSYYLARLFNQSFITIIKSIEVLQAKSTIFYFVNMHWYQHHNHQKQHASQSFHYFNLSVPTSEESCAMPDPSSTRKGHPHSISGTTEIGTQFPDSMRPQEWGIWTTDGYLLVPSSTKRVVLRNGSVIIFSDSTRYQSVSTQTENIDVQPTTSTNGGALVNLETQCTKF